MKKMILCAALAAACAAFGAGSASAAPAVPPAPRAPAEKVVTPPSRTYMDSVMRAEYDGTAGRPMRGVVMAYEEMRGPRAMRPGPVMRGPGPARAEGVRQAGFNDDGVRRPARPPRGDVRRGDDRQAPPQAARRGERRYHRYGPDGRVHCPYGYDHRRGDCPYYEERRAYYYDDDRYDDWDDDGWYDDDGYYHHRAYRHHRGYWY